MDTFVDEIRKEKDGKTVQLARFYAEYRNTPHIYYGFVEGKDDPSYYRKTIKDRIEHNYDIKLYPLEGKSNVKYAFEEIRKRNYPKNRIVYFIDRDLSRIINDTNLIMDEYVYITDKYSIENDILTDETLVSVAQDILGFAFAPQEDIEIIKKTYNIQLKCFVDVILPLMANIIIWKRKSVHKPNYNNVQIDKLCKVKNGLLELKLSDDQIIREFYKQSNVNFSIYDLNETNTIIVEVKQKELAFQIIRGKYLASFFLMFCNSLWEDWDKIPLNTQPVKPRKVGDRDIMDIIAPRARVPKSLDNFIRNTIVKYFTAISTAKSSN